MLAASYLPVSTLVPKLNTKSSPSNSFSSDSSTDSTTENPLGPSKCNPERTGAEDEEALAERFGRILGLVGNEEVEVERERTESEEIESREFWGAMNRARRVYSASIFAHTESQWTASRAEIEQRGSMKQQKEKSKSLW